MMMDDKSRDETTVMVVNKNASATVNHPFPFIAAVFPVIFDAMMSQFIDMYPLNCIPNEIVKIKKKKRIK
jgi:hypothetical protein